MTDYYVGQKVVCIDVSPSGNGRLPLELTLNAIYTITGFLNSSGYEAGIYLAEVKAMGNCEGHSDAFAATRFRPLVETKSEVSFTIGADPDSEKWDNRKVKVK